MENVKLYRFLVKRPIHHAAECVWYKSVATMVDEGYVLEEIQKDQHAINALMDDPSERMIQLHKMLWEL